MYIILDLGIQTVRVSQLEMETHSKPKVRKTDQNPLSSVCVCVCVSEIQAE